MLGLIISNKNDCFFAAREGGRCRVETSKSISAVRVEPGAAMSIPGEMLKRGWGVMRLKPWRLAGIFASSVEAENFAVSLGPDYVVKYGEHVAGSLDFDFANAPETSA